LEMAAALAMKAQGKVPLLVKDVVIPKRKPARTRPERATPEAGMDRYRMAVGHMHKVNPNQIVWAIAHSAGLQSRQIGRITINQDHSFIDLPEGLPLRIQKLLKQTRVCQIPLELRLISGRPAKAKGKSFGPKAHTAKKAFKKKHRHDHKK
jgi:ATP-dependent RNA helicase DeaD